MSLAPHSNESDNLDGYLNLMETNDAKREAVVAEHVQILKTELAAHGFTFVATASIAILRVDT